MDIYLNVDFKDEVDKGLLAILAQELTFDGIRLDVRTEDKLDISDLLISCQAVGLKVILLIPNDIEYENREILLSEISSLTEIIYNTSVPLDNVAIELINEPEIFGDYWKNKPEQLGHIVNECIDIIRQKLYTVTVLLPAIANLGSNNIKYLKGMFSTLDLTKAFTVSVHRYPANLHHWDSVHRPFGTRDQEVEALKSVIGSRKFWMTEVGCTQNYKKKKFLCPKTINISEEEQTDYCRKETVYWKNKFVPAMVWYQINDGPDNEEKEDGFGIRKFDNTPKDIWHKLSQIITTAHIGDQK